MVIKRFSIYDLFAHTTLLAGLLVILLPFAWMFLTSFKPPEEIYGTNLSFLPERWEGFSNYRAAFTKVPLLRIMFNGVLVCGLILFFQVLFAAPCGYALAKLDFPGNRLLFIAVLMGLLIPMQIPALPLYVVIAKVGLLDTYTSLVLPFTGSVFAIFLFRQFFKSYPDEIIDAARIDGFGELAIVWRIILPTAWPAVAAFAIHSVVAHWNDLYWPLVVVSSPEMMTPSYGVAYFREGSETGGDVGALMAAGVVATIPLVIAFLFAQKHFMSGLTIGSKS